MGNLLSEANIKKFGMLVLALFIISQVGFLRNITGQGKGSLPQVNG